MNSLTPITDKVEVDDILLAPKDPWKFGVEIQVSQDRSKLPAVHNILFNKGKYFETSIYNKNLIQEVSELSGISIQYNNMIVANWKKMEEFVLAMNCFGIYVVIDIDWI